MFVLRRGLVVFACVPLLLVGACGDDTPKSDGPRTPSTSTSTSAAPSPSESESVLPEDRPASEVTPEQIVHAWFEAYNELTLTGDGARLREMSSTKCFTCGSLADQYEEIYKAGGSTVTEGPPNAITSIKTSGFADPSKGVTRLLVEFKGNPGVTKESRSASSTTFEAEAFSWIIDLGVAESQWQILEVAG